MRLFLSSQDLGNFGSVAVEMAGQNKKLAYIKNSQDNLPEGERNFTTPERKQRFEKLGFVFEELDLREYFGKHDKLREVLSGFGAVMCAGGNTFILRRAMKESGFDNIIKDMLNEDKILYGGWSAGACVTAHSLKELARGDLPGSEVVPDSYPSKETIWEGLGLVNFTIVPHCDMDWFKDDARKIISNLESTGKRYYALNDGEVIIVKGKKVEVLR